MCVFCGLMLHFLLKWSLDFCTKLTLISDSKFLVSKCFIVLYDLSQPHISTALLSLHISCLSIMQSCNIDLWPYDFSEPHFHQLWVRHKTVKQHCYKKFSSSSSFWKSTFKTLKSVIAYHVDFGNMTNAWDVHRYANFHGVSCINKHELTHRCPNWAATINKTMLSFMQCHWKQY